jgi:hypothetical protein
MIGAPSDPAEAVAQAAEALLRRLEAVEHALRDLYWMAANHGMPYNGPTYGTEKMALEQALAVYRMSRRSGATGDR